MIQLDPWLQVRDHIPLEQGLRLLRSATCAGRQTVRDHIPLEQGLRRSGRGGTESNPSSETIFH